MHIKLMKNRRTNELEEEIRGLKWESSFENS